MTFLRRIAVLCGVIVRLQVVEASSGAIVGAGPLRLKQMILFKVVPWFSLGL